MSSHTTHLILWIGEIPWSMAISFRISASLIWQKQCKFWMFPKTQSEAAVHTNTSRDGMQKESVFFSIELMERAEATARDMNIGFSQLVREALDQFLARREKQNADGELGAACRNYKEVSKGYAAEWSRFETTIR